jgi:hypothetical protein
MFTNKHVVVALLIAPLLSILAWLAVGNLLGDKAVPAAPGQSYPLIEKSSCRYASGFCELENKDIKLTLRLDESRGKSLELSASHPLETALMALAPASSERGPRAMQALDEQGLRWQFVLGDTVSPDERIRLVVSVAGSAYFAEASTAFLQHGNRP